MRESWPKIPYAEQRLRRLRQAVPASLSELADAAGVSYGYLRRVEVTSQQPSPETATRIARGLSKLTGRTVGVDEFYDGPTARDAA